MFEICSLCCLRQAEIHLFFKTTMWKICTDCALNVENRGKETEEFMNAHREYMKKYLSEFYRSVSSKKETEILKSLNTEYLTKEFWDELSKIKTMTTNDGYNYVYTYKDENDLKE